MQVRKDAIYARRILTAKLRGNVERDQRAVSKLAEMGWRVLNVWECAMRDPEAATVLPKALQQWINSGVSFGEISARSLAADTKSEVGGAL